jgi:hypothetical protein
VAAARRPVVQEGAVAAAVIGLQGQDVHRKTAPPARRRELPEAFHPDFAYNSSILESGVVSDGPFRPAPQRAGVET